MLAERAPSEGPRPTRARWDRSRLPFEECNEQAWKEHIVLCSCNARPKKALAWDSGTFRRASGWEGEEVARTGRPIRPPSCKEGTSELGWIINIVQCAQRRAVWQVHKVQGQAMAPLGQHHCPRSTEKYFSRRHHSLCSHAICFQVGRANLI